MFKKQENKPDLPELHWTTVFTVEFSNTNLLHHQQRKTSIEEIEVKTTGTEATFHEAIVNDFNAKRLEKSVELGKIYCLVKKISLQAFSDEARTNSVPSAKPHYNLNRVVESFYGMKTYSLLRSATN